MFKTNLTKVLENRLMIANKNIEKNIKKEHYESEAYFLEDMLCLITNISED